MSISKWPRRLSLVIAMAASTGIAAPHNADTLRVPDHYEFDAILDAAFQADAQGSFPIRLSFDYAAAGASTLSAWQVDVLSPGGTVIRRWIGETRLSDDRGTHRFSWDGKDNNGRSLPSGFYTVRLRAVPAVLLPGEARQPLARRIAQSFALGRDELVDQRYDVRLGRLIAPRMPTFRALPTGTPPRLAKGATSGQSTPAGALPYTIYYGNLHSQTNHSDGGAPVASCGGSEVPQGGQFGPADAYAMMDAQAGGDFLLASEHNHMYDGSTGTNTAATPATANNLFNSGLDDATAYNNAHADFLALYGNEWGVISNGGHLNLINPDALPSWEYNASGQLIGSVATVKSDYANLYAVMKQRGWIGQFNHPSTSQFLVGGVGMGYDANGAEVMVLTEIMNTSAFSTNTTESETSRSTYPGAFNTLLERGYKVAPATNQDNHCANWGLSFRNRTGVLIGNGVALTQANFVDALKARRVFASEDKTAQLVLTGNGAVMGQTVANSGALTLAANYASASGGSATRVQFFEGVPGRNGTVTQLFEGSGTHTFTPALGEHFYYALVTEADGDRLWSAPIWVSQGVGGSDTTAPTVSASESGTSGTITLSAAASDNVGVTNVEFYIDGVLSGSDASSPYALSVNSTTLADGSHTLTAKAFDAAGNTATSAPVAFTVSNAALPVERVLNGGFEAGKTNWSAPSGVVTKSTTYAAHAGVWKAWLNGNGRVNTEYAYQTVAIPAAATSATLALWMRVVSAETTTTTAYDTVKVQLRNTSNGVLATLATYSNLNKGSSYVQRTFDVSAYKGQTVRVYFEGIEGSQVATSFLIDDVSLLTR